ncbi:MAG: hypothetical protein QF632_04200 [Candidatus Woesearchaeota archaeon]|jgi:Arc/MetJ-type ribon-helix-helix transcriptional regulator|nr:hypothetical protein [Candidatus Woesearchaeota archaeon]MDP7323934.1 hypothetical protein [Candidatus Woesearchaeota archaeon]
MNTRINVNIPEALFNKSQELVEQGYFANFSELVREGLRKELADFQMKDAILTEDERKLFLLLQKAESEGLLLSEKEMKKHGLKI